MDNFEIEVLDNAKKEDIIYFVKENDTLSSIASKFCVDKSIILVDNGISENERIEEGDILWIRRKNTASYVVKPLDTIEKIAQKFNVTAEHIKNLNAINAVHIGQKIYI